MAKLYFRYGAVSSAKTLNLLAVAHNYRSQDKKVILIKPAFDVRYGKNTIRSRAGIEKQADVIVNQDTDLTQLNLDGVSCILVDEVQFFNPHHIDIFREMTRIYCIPVICYGLRNDFRGHLFDGSKRLMELADTIEEVKTTCNFCDKKAVFNLKYINGAATFDGPNKELGAEEKFLPACYHCFVKEHLKAKSLVQGDTNAYCFTDFA
ncbi:MAG: thymidine kinase [Parachlamydiales bacterium]|nr:thymidine kinase [Parachlamydiales bacterium]